MRVIVWSVLLWACVSFWLGVISLLGGCRHVPAVLDAVEQAVPPPPVVTPTTGPATTTTQPPEPVATGDAIAPESIRTKGSRANLRPQNARIKPGLAFTARHTARGLSFDYVPHGWTGGATVARIYAAFEVDGQYIGGHWDDVRPNQKAKALVNITGHEGETRFGVVPQDGQPVAYWISNLANTERSEIVWASNRWGER